MSELKYSEETYRIIGACMEVHSALGKGHDEVLYKDALEIEFGRQQIPYAREVPFEVEYKGVLLRHPYFADFTVFDKIILEVKAIDTLTSSHVKQTLNYLAASGLKVGLLVNFGEDSLKSKRVAL